MVIQIKDKQIRKDLMDTFIEFKKQITGLYAIMKKDAYANLDNVTLAQLNDVAYRAIRKTGNRKKLDERAQKNEEMYKKLDIQLEKELKKMNHDEMEANEKIQNISGIIGICPVSQ